MGHQTQLLDEPEQPWVWVRLKLGEDYLLSCGRNRSASYWTRKGFQVVENPPVLET